MDNSRIIELLARKMAGEASSYELEELEELMLRYPESVYYDEFLKQIWLNTDEEAEGIPDTDRLYRLHQLKFKNELARGQSEHPVRSHRYKGMLILSIITVILVFTGICYFVRNDHSTARIEITAGKGLRKKIKLPDGTLVWLNSESRLSYDPDISTKEKRIVHLEGEAFFDVAHRKRQAFIVCTEKLSVKVLGTAFNIKAYRREAKSETTLIRGSIEFSVNSRSGQKIVMNPSETIAMEEKYVQKKNSAADTSIEDISLQIKRIVPVKIGAQEYIEETSWKDNSLVFSNESLEQLKPKFERWFNVRIELNSVNSRAYRFTGVFKKESIGEALLAMQLIKPFTFKIKEHDVIIY